MVGLKTINIVDLDRRELVSLGLNVANECASCLMLLTSIHEFAIVDSDFLLNTRLRSSS